VIDMDDEKEFQAALFRFSLISQLLHCKDEAERRRICAELASKQMEMPHSMKTRITAKTIENYLLRYEKHGFEGLKRKKRIDRNRVKSISEDILGKIKSLKEEEPRRSTAQIIRLIKAMEEYKHISLAERTVSRILKNSNLSGKDFKPKKIHRSFEMDTINDLWETDICEGIFLKRPNKMTHCLAFLDDYSRIIPHAQFYLDEKLPRLEDSLKKAVLKRGVPKAIYADNGRIFVSNHFRRVCAELGINLIHHLPYNPQSKGKIERFFLRMQKEFLLEAENADIHTLDELNSYFQSWLEIEYHRREHFGIGAMPLDRFTAALSSTKIRVIESMEEITEIFLYREKRKVHKKNGVIRLAGSKYQVTDASLLNLEIEARYDPFDMTRIFIYRDSKFVQTALPLNLKNSPVPFVPEEKKKSENTIRQSSIDFFIKLKKKEQEISKKESQKIDFSKIKKED